MPVSEIFRIQNAQELKASEKRYLPQPKADVRALVLAASQGDLGALVDERPKSMLFVKGKPILTWQIEAFNRQGSEVVVDLTEQAVTRYNQAVSAGRRVVAGLHLTC